ncbi:MAG TPA: rod shape-determining protein MreD [Alphaproteobacteria bacterium]|nr:rod shape-determining protein MreD [Alphaproteobacteria bacterium]
MKTSRPSGEIQRVISAAIPSVTSILFVLAGVVPSGAPGISSVAPLLSVAAIFFWVVSRPGLMPPASVFCIGLLQDVLSGGPIGLWALTLLLVQYLSLSQRQFLVDQTFIFSWVGFTSVVIGAALLAWLSACVYYDVLLSPMPVIVQAALTVLVYPLMALLLISVSRLIPAAP